MDQSLNVLLFPIEERSEGSCLEREEDDEVGNVLTGTAASYKG